MSLSDEVRALPEGQRQIVREAGIWLSWLQARLARIDATWTARRKRAREVQDLYRFTDRELWDVGLSRSDLPAIADGTYRRD
jgi:uncharacterized protein YjiS (DUF1127 family)